MARAVCLRLNCSMVAVVGPRNAMPAPSMALANSIFSDRKPYLRLPEGDRQTAILMRGAASDAAI